MRCALGKGLVASEGSVTVGRAVQAKHALARSTWGKEKLVRIMGLEVLHVSQTDPLNSTCCDPCAEKGHAKQRQLASMLAVACAACRSSKSGRTRIAICQSEMGPAGIWSLPASQHKEACQVCFAFGFTRGGSALRAAVHAVSSDRLQGWDHV